LTHVPRSSDDPRRGQGLSLEQLAALESGDVDLEHRILHIHSSDDRVRRRGVTSTKGDKARRIPIEPALVPLLTALHAEAKGKGHVFQLPSPGVLSRKLKGYLKRAGVTRADLFKGDKTRKAITFHDLRATGITWCAVRGDEPFKIMQRARHADLSTTQIYVRDAENLAAGFGAVFPELPPDLLVRSFAALSLRSESQMAKRAKLQGVRGGADEDRTRDLIHAMDALSQLSYGPDGRRYLLRRGRRVSHFSLLEPGAPPKHREKPRQNLIPLSARCFHQRYPR
jgi:hypothetical protein